MRKGKVRKRKVYDCLTVGELIDYIAYKFKIDTTYVSVDGADRIFIGNIRRRDLEVKREKVHTSEGTLDGIVLYQIESRVLKDYYE